jgi:polyphenol oxidase
MMNSREREQGRREFLEQLGLGAGALAFLGFPGFARPAQAQCPVIDPGTATAFRYDCRPIRPRRPASTLSSADIQKLRDAYKAMRALDTSDPTDPRGLLQQANVHCRYCTNASLQVHFSWQFFPWHRAMLYFHERILGNLIKDPEFRIPYWDWDAPTHRRIPGAYADPGNATNPLWNSTRVMSATDELPEEDVGEDVMDNVLTLGTFSDFGGTATSSGVPEGTPHGAVHVDVGGNMGNFENAGKDPIFYAHHCNLDKVWSDWNKRLPTHTNPTTAAFLNLSWNFFDEGKRWTSIKASQVLDHESGLRYIYGPSRFSELLPCILRWVIIRTDWAKTQRIALTPALKGSLTKIASDRQARIRMDLMGMVVPVDRSAVYRVYATQRDAEENAGPKSPGYLGTIPVVLNDAKNTHKPSETRRASFNVSARLAQLLSRDAAIEPFLVERVRGQADKPRILKVRARDVSFSYGRPE